MTNFFAFISFEFKRFAGKRNLAIMLCTLLILIIFVNNPIREQKNQPAKIQKFSQIQKKYFENAPNYDCYGRDGVTMLYAPAKTNVLFKNNITPRDLTARADSVVTLQVINNMKGKSLISRLFFGGIDAGLVVLFAVTLLVLFYGYETLHDYRYIMFLAGIKAKGSFLPALVFSRFLAFTTGFLLVISGLMLFIHTRGIHFDSNAYHGLFILLLLVMAMSLVFFLIGFTLGTIPSVKGALFLLFLIWIAMIFAVPGILVSTQEDNFPDVVSDFQTTLNKFDNVINFEKDSEKKEGKFDRNKIDIFRNYVKKYRDVVFNKNEAAEVGLKTQIEANIKRVNKWGVLFPTTFYLLTCSEVSSCGYRSFIDFFIYAIDMMRKFVSFWIDRVFYHDPKQLVNFIQKDENVFHARPSLPPYAGAGFAALFFYILAMYITGSLCYKKWLFPRWKKKEAFAGKAINFKTNKKTTVRYYDTNFYRQFLNIFMTRYRNPNWNVIIDGKVIGESDKPTVIYLPNPDFLPRDIKTRQLLYFLKKIMKLPRNKFQLVKNSLDKKILDQRFAGLEKIDRAKIMLSMALLANKQVYIFDNFISGIPDTLRWELAQILEENIGPGTVVIDLVSNDDRWLNHDNMFTVIYKNNRYEIIPKSNQ
jgi:Ca2+/Na+ antiporter